MRGRDAPALVAIALIAAFSTLAPPADWLRGLSLDGLFLLRAELFPASPSAAPPVVVVALDEETYRRPPFRGTPKPLWTPELGRVLDAVVDGRASVVGFDLILPTSVESRLRGHDRPFMLALRRASLMNRVVLARAQYRERRLDPSPGLAIAVGRDRNIRLANLLVDVDGVVRRAPLWFASTEGSGGGHVTSLSLELASRHLGARPVRTADGGVAFGNSPVRGSGADGLLLDFRAGSSFFPVHSLADLHACAEAGRTGFFREHFEGKVVLFGAVLDVEDRLLTSKRLITGPERDRRAPRCANPVMEDLFADEGQRELIPGVLIHATAVENLVRGAGLARPGPLASFFVVLALAALAGWMFLRWPLGRAALVLVILSAIWSVAAAWALRRGLVLPGLTSGMALIVAILLATAWRHFVTDRDRRTIRNTFSLYLSPAVLERVLERDSGPALGGELREVTVLISDLAGFTSLSEKTPPEQVVDLLNLYLGELADAVERHGGFVDKFMGDGMMAVFGAPLDDPDHAAHAIAASEDILRAIATDDRLVGPGGERLHTRIGIATGSAVVGNIGSARRINYTVVGDTVNLAARLETENKAHDTRLLVSEATACAAGLERFRRIDSIQVRGREKRVTVYTLDATD